MTARASSLFYAEDPAITTDLAQFLTNLTASGGGGYELASARTAVQENREVSVVLEANNATAGVLVAHANLALTNINYFLNIGAGQIEIGDSSATYLQANMPGVSASTDDWAVQWTT